MVISRHRAAATHLCISVAVAFAAALLVLLIWFPFPYSKLARGYPLLLLIISVDMVLGPLLTWIIFNPSKRKSEIFFDISIIGLMQILALIYGLHSAYMARPIYLVHEIDRFVVVTASDVGDEIYSAPIDLQSPKMGEVKMIGLREIKDPTERMKSVELALAGRDISLRPEYWQNISEKNMTAIRQRVRSLSEINRDSKFNNDEINALIEEIKTPAQDLVFLPVVGKGEVWSAVMDKSKLDILGYLKIDGF